MHPGRTGASVRPHPQRSAAALTSGSDGDVEIVPGHVCQVIRGGEMSEKKTHGCALRWGRTDAPVRPGCTQVFSGPATKGGAGTDVDQSHGSDRQAGALHGHFD